MTSWNRGKENEEMGEREMNESGLGNKVGGAGRKMEGEAEQGLDNLGDTMSGKQRDLEGNERNYEGSNQKRVERVTCELGACDHLEAGESGTRQIR